MFWLVMVAVVGLAIATLVMLRIRRWL